MRYRKLLLPLLLLTVSGSFLGAAPRQQPTDAEVLAKMMWGEGRGVQTKTEKAALCWCVLNRVDDPRYPDTVYEVVTAPSQFLGYDAANPVDPSLLAIAEDVLARWQAEKSCIGSIGRVLPREYTNFTGDGVENHFTRSFHGKRIEWNWSAPNPYGEPDFID